jgi:hypothetical protein
MDAADYDDLFDETERAERKKFPPLWPTAEDDWNAEPPGWVIERLMQEDSDVLLYGPPGWLKSFVALEILYGIGTGCPVLGLSVVRAGPVFYFCGEGYTSMRTKRRAAWEIHHGYDVSERFLDVIRFTKQLPYLNDQEIVANLVHEAKLILGDRQAGGFAIDTMSRCLNGEDEDRAGVIARYLNIAKAIREQIGGVSLTLHHTGKDRTRGARGSSGISGGFDTVLGIQNHHKGEDMMTHTIDVFVEKHKDADNGEHHYAQSVAIPTRWGDSLALNVCDRDIALAVLDGSADTGRREGLSAAEVEQAIRALKPFGGICTMPELTKKIAELNPNRKADTVRVTLSTKRGRGEKFERYWIDGRGWAIPGRHLEGCGESLQAQLDSLKMIDALHN